MKEILLNHVVSTVQKSNLCDEPSTHFEFSDIFPSDFYAEIILRFPTKECFKPLMHRDALMKDGGSSRGEICLNLNGLEQLNDEDKDFWLLIGDIFRSDLLRKTLQDKLNLTGNLLAKPSLYQDRSGYQIQP